MKKFLWNCLGMGLALLISGASCLGTGDNGDGEHPCKEENHCIRADGKSGCEDGFEWENPEDGDNYNCVPVGGGNPNTGDCREVGCQGFYYCDLASGDCLAGCSTDGQCDSNESCNLSTHQCECNAGTHMCSEQCVANTSVDHCGSSCTPCTPPANSTATCNGSQCGFNCSSGRENCGGVCALCPSGPGIQNTTCQGTTCVVSSCAAGYAECDSGCCAWTASAISDISDADANTLLDAFADGTSLHVAYIGSGGDMAHAKKVGSGAWSDRDFISSGRGDFLSLAVSANGMPHVVSESTITGDLIYYALEGDTLPSWRVATDAPFQRVARVYPGNPAFPDECDIWSVDSNAGLRAAIGYPGAIGSWSTFDADGAISDFVMLAPYGGGDTFWVNASGGYIDWHVNQGGTSGSIYEGTIRSVNAVRDGDVFHVVWTNSEGTIRYARIDDQGAGSTETVMAYYGSDADIALNDLSWPVVAGVSSASNAVTLWERGTPNWTEVHEFSNADPGEDVDIVADSSGQLHVFYANTGTGALMHATPQ
jgi:hypothetical protein